MTNQVEKTPRQISIDNGEQIVITMIACFVLFEVFVLIVGIINGLGPGIMEVIRWTIMIVSCVNLYKGKNWAKLFLTFGAVLGAFRSVRYVVLVLNNPVFSVFNLSLFLGILILNSVIAWYLLFSGDIDEFMKSLKT